MRALKLFAFSAILLLTLAACGGENIETNMSETVADFEYTTQDEDSFGLDDLKGQYWVADFVFTNCTTQCLPMSSNMSYLQDKINEEGLDDVHLVSFSIDPDYDTPEVLSEYAEEYDADLDRWTFLTGYDFDTIKKLSIKSFKNMVQEPPSGSDQVTHGTAFYLVNPDGEVIKSYDGLSKESMDDIFEDLKAVSS